MLIPGNLIALIFYIAIFAGLIVLQVYLSRRESRWPGLILPILSFLISLLAASAVVAFTAATGSGKLTVSKETNGPDGTVNTEIVSEELWQGEEGVDGIGEALLGAGLVFLVYNIPTAVYTVIYFSEREKYRRREQIKKMNIQDLE